MEAALDACAIFENLRRKPLRDEYKCSAVRQGKDRKREGWNTYPFNRVLFKVVEEGGDSEAIIIALAEEVKHINRCT